MYRLLIIIFFLVSFCKVRSQEVTEKQLFEVFKTSIRQPDKNKVSIGSNPWLICNTDSSFNKSDTIILYNGNQNSLVSCCDIITWTFYKKDKFVSAKEQSCKEPTTASAVGEKDWFQIKAFSELDNVFIKITNAGKIVERFQVLKIEKDFNNPKEAVYRIILLRPVIFD